MSEAVVSPRFAYATLVTTDSYVEGALVLLHSLRRTMTPYSIVCLATPSSLSEHSLQRLRAHFDGVIEAELRLSTDDANLDVLGRPDLRSTLTKIQLWDPALFGAWDAICYLDADTLVRQPIDDMFSRFDSWRHERSSDWKQGGLIAAAPDTGWPDCFNSGVLLLAPGYDCYRDLITRAASSSASFDGADQGLLNEHFADWSSASPYRRLPFLYNATANVYYTYRPALQRFGHDVRVVHFIGISKPWHWERSSGGLLHSDSTTSERWRQLVSLWWSIHDECVSGWKHWKGPYDKGLAFGKGYHHITEPPAPLLAHADQDSSAHVDAYGGATTCNQLPQEVPDWEKDWSWAADRVHPLDYSYLTTHANMPEQHGGHEEHSQSHTPHHESSSLSHESHHDSSSKSHDHKDYHDHYERHRGDEEAPNHYYRHHEEIEHHHRYQNCAHEGHTGQHAHQQPRHDQPATPHHQEQPAWMQSQRPWEDVAREGWMHHDEYKPHKYDQAYVDRHIDQPRYEDRYHNRHHGGEHYHWHGSDGGSEYVPMPLPDNQALYEATQVVLQPRDSGNAPYHYQPHWHHSDHHDNATYDSQQQQQHYAGYQEHHYYSHGDHYNPHHEHHQPQMPDARSSRSTSDSSPLHYPQPKSPMIVNPVALWESSEEQSRRRAWAERVRGPLADLQPPADSTVPWLAAPPSADQCILPSTMDLIDSSQLPRETPWKISHVRQRPSSFDENSPTVPPQPTQMGTQFKEGVANDGNAREAAEQLLQRWNEAVIARNLRSQFGNIDPEQILHSIAKVERGTDAIRLETTVSCEAEDSSGERTVYRFTLSSTLDVGGALPAAPQAPLSVPSMQQQQQQGSVSVPGAKQPNPSLTRARSSAVAPEDLYDDNGVDVTVLRQPPNYQEPAMSRRSSFVQLQPLQQNSTRVPMSAMRTGPDYSDQFAESDARYWRLQRQLIDLEMNQRRLDNGAQATPGGPPTSADRNAGGWDDQGSQRLDLESPPTPTRNDKPPGGFDDRPVNRLIRRPSAFSVADPDVLAPLGGQVPSESNPAAGSKNPDPRVRADARSALESTGGIAQRRQRSASSPRLPDESLSLNDSTLPSALNAGVPHVQSPLAAVFDAPNKKPVASGATAGAVSPSLSKRSRSYTALHRIATHNSAQAAAATPIAAKATMHAAFSSSPPVSLQAGGLHVDTDSDADGQEFKPASGRSPTPFPRALFAKSGATASMTSGGGDDDADLDSGQPDQSSKRPDLGLLSIEPRGSGFEPSGIDMSPASAGTPVTLGRQKLRPKINWGDDEDSAVPPENDQSIDAQWLRIINGAPPSRAPILPASAPKDDDRAKTSKSEAALAESQSHPIQAKIQSDDDGAEEAVGTDEMPGLRSLDADEGGDDDDVAQDERELPSITAMSAPVLEPVQNGSPPASPVVPPAPGTRAPPRKLHSTRSFLNLSSREYDTLSDSEVDVTEAELQARFWARAMKPTKSGNSSPYSPGRRKSVVEMSSAISPRDLEEWMQWQGDNAILDRQIPCEPAGTRDDVGDYVCPTSPPASNGASGSRGQTGMFAAADDEGSDSDSSDDDALQMQRPQDAAARGTLGQYLDESAEKRVAAYGEAIATEGADVESECDSCFDSIEYAELVESTKSVSAISSSPIDTGVAMSQLSMDPLQ
ncbi:glycogenin glucosyltransferase [Coemansia sp. BCRC 34301]|nr:glycogenin glucosyltransferase [Coemansia sp. BCRC 34301]